MSQAEDKIYLFGKPKPGSFTFDENVARVFEDMISRSVPGYQQILEMLPSLSRQFRQEGANYYDLGCSLAAGLLAVRLGLNNSSGHLIGVDTSKAMLDRAEKSLQQAHPNTWELREQDIRNSEISNAAIVLLNFTLQFIALEDRHSVLSNIYQGLKENGVLVLSEKLKMPSELIEQKMNDIHLQYKADQGYSELEISRKREAIENVLIAETYETHKQRLEQIGFSIVFPWIQNLQFISFLAIK